MIGAFLKKCQHDLRCRFFYDIFLYTCTLRILLQIFSNCNCNCIKCNYLIRISIFYSEYIKQYISYNILCYHFYIAHIKIFLQIITIWKIMYLKYINCENETTMYNI